MVNEATTEVALAASFTLPVFFHGSPQADEETGPFLIEIDGRSYLTEGHIFLDRRNLWVGCTWLEGRSCKGANGYQQALPAETHDWSCYEDSEAEAEEAANRWQIEMAEQTGLLFPIYRR